MMNHKIICFTSFSFSYIAKARLLAWSLKRFHPDWHIIAVITDKFPEDCPQSIIDEYFDEVLWSYNLPIDDFNSWIFKHDIVEACTAVKGTASRYILESYNPDKLIYLDPDIAVINNLDPIINYLDNYSIVITPHILSPENERIGIVDNEISSLKHGIFNLGFIALKNNSDSIDFAHWWEERLREFCYDDIPNGIFTDQRWCDFIPVFFNNVLILKDPGFNVASWNLSNRKLAFNGDGMLEVNGSLLRFYHFTKLGPVGETMTSRYAKDNVEVYELWEWYKYLTENKFKEYDIPKGWWFYNFFSNGETISKEIRTLYRKREDLQISFSNPFDSEGLLNWFKTNIYSEI